MGRQPEPGKAVWCARCRVSNPSGRKEFQSCGGLTALTGRQRQPKVRSNTGTCKEIASVFTCRQQAELRDPELKEGLAGSPLSLARLSSFAVPPMLEGKTMSNEIERLLDFRKLHEGIVREIN